MGGQSGTLRTEVLLSVGCIAVSVTMNDSFHLFCGSYGSSVSLKNDITATVFLLLRLPHPILLPLPSPTPPPHLLPPFSFTLTPLSYIPSVGVVLIKSMFNFMSSHQADILDHKHTHHHTHIHKNACTHTHAHCFTLVSVATF